MLMGSRIARLFIAIYATVLHFMIVLLMYYAAMPCPSAVDEAPGAVSASTISTSVAAVSGAAVAAARAL